MKFSVTSKLESKTNAAGIEIHTSFFVVLPGAGKRQSAKFLQVSAGETLVLCPRTGVRSFNRNISGIRKSSKAQDYSIEADYDTVNKRVVPYFSAYFLVGLPIKGMQVRYVSYTGIYGLAGQHSEITVA